LAVGLFLQRNKCELRSSVDRHEQIELAFFGADLSDIDVKVADRVGLEFALVRCFAFYLGQARNAVAKQAAMQ
jgi:hypothetical protein